MDHYGKARRDGLRIYTAALQAHEDPYLPVLEKKVPELASLARLSLGVISVPLSRVLGSVSEGRSKAFTKNFLPILDGGSEFAAKWDRLYESVESEGVRQPVTALEYLGYYYIIEGNKRVSVMKANGAKEIEADVSRPGRRIRRSFPIMNTVTSRRKPASTPSCSPVPAPIRNWSPCRG